VRVSSSLTSEFHWEHGEYFQQLVLAMAICWGRRNVANMYRHLDASTHRTRFNNFMKVGRWNPERLLQQKAYEILGQLKIKPGSIIYLVLDDSHNPKCARKMEAVGVFRDGVSGQMMRSHQFVSAVLRVGNVTIPWGIRLYAKKEASKKLKAPFRKTTALAAELIRAFDPPAGVRVVVLFDAYYLCRRVVRACKDQGFRFISVLKSNRNLFRGGRKLKAGKYVKNTFHRSKAKRTMRAGKTSYQVVDAGWLDLNGAGSVHLICSRRTGEKRILGIVTDMPRIAARTIIRTYAERWCIELFFKDGKQLLGLGQYQNGSFRAVVTHLHLVCFAYALLTHFRIMRERAQGKRKTKAFVSFTTASMQNELRRTVFLDLVAHLKKEHRSGDSFVKELERLWVA
jgi:SRSO17 transposase